MTPMNLSSLGAKELSITDLMCFGNHKEKGIRNVWALLVALNKCRSFNYLTLLENFSSSLLFKKAAFKFLFCTLATTNVCVRPLWSTFRH